MIRYQPGRVIHRQTLTKKKALSPAPAVQPCILEQPATARPGGTAVRDAVSKFAAIRACVEVIRDAYSDARVKNMEVSIPKREVVRQTLQEFGISVRLREND